MWCTVMWCTALWCDALWCIVLYCTVVCCIVMWCTVMHCTVVWCTTFLHFHLMLDALTCWKISPYKITVSCSGLQQWRWQKYIDFAAFGNKPTTPALSFLALIFIALDCTTALLCSRLYNVHSDHCCILLAGGSVCAHPDGGALIWELGRLLLRLRTHNGGHQIGTQYVRDTGSLTWEFQRKMLLRFRKHNGLFLDFYR